jgi:hypothetical protein
MELYSLRILLITVAGPTSFENLQTYEDTRYETFQAAANARGLLESDFEWDRCLGEACDMAPSAKMVRLLFCLILVNCSPADPLALWIKHRDGMAVDFAMDLKRDLHIPRETTLDADQLKYTYKRALGHIDQQLQTTGNRLSDYPTMPQETLNDNDSDPYRETLELRELRGYSATDQAAILRVYVDQLNDDQRHAYYRILGAINSIETDPTASKIFFVNGPGGTGKSHLFKTLLSYVRSENRVALPVATSGIAAILLPGGRTAHSRFKIPLNATYDLVAHTLI